jgi:transposase
MPVRVEILNGVERRRRWSEDEKARIIEESFASGTKVSEVARKYGVSRGLIFAWRKEARVDGLAISTVPRLIPVQIAAPPVIPSNLVPAPLVQPASPQIRSPGRKPGLIEIDLGGGKRIRVDANVDANALGRVLEVLGRK